MVSVSDNFDSPKDRLNTEEFNSISYEICNFVIDTFNKREKAVSAVDALTAVKIAEATFIMSITDGLSEEDNKTNWEEFVGKLLDATTRRMGQVIPQICPEAANSNNRIIN